MAAGVIFLCLLLGLHSRDGLEGRGVRVETQYAAASSEVVPPAAPKLNINTAGADELAALPGIGNVLAERVVAYREAHGKFQSTEDIRKVKGIGEGKFSEIAGQITVKEETS